MSNEQRKQFSESELEAIARALGDTDDGLTNAEIEMLFAPCNMNDPGPGTKWKRIYNAFGESQKRTVGREAILAFVRKAMKPVKYVKTPERYETLRGSVNRALLFSGLAVAQTGELTPVKVAGTISDANQRANDLRADLKARGVHPDVLKFCREELLADNYFHAVLEASKSVADKIRLRTGLTDDGAVLIDRALCGQAPMLTINALKTESERSEQSGFANLVKGAFGMFRNVTAHEAKIRWKMTKSDAEDLLSLVSLIHRRLDDATIRSGV